MSVKARIKNVLNYKKPSFWVMVLAVLATVALIAAFATNPKPDHTASDLYLGYSINALMDNKTPYVGNNVKVIGLIDAMPLPEGIVRDKVELQTANLPYGITINYTMHDSSGVVVNGAISGDAFYRNAIVLFSLIDNVGVINCKITDKTGRYDGAAYTFIYTREAAEELLGEDVRRFAGSSDNLKDFIGRIANTPLGKNGATRINGVNGADTVPSATVKIQIEDYLEIIVSSPNASSNPHDYIKAHQHEYDSILKMGDEALNYLLSQFEKGGHNDLKGYIMMSLCKELLGLRNNVTDETLTPQEWYAALSIREEVKLPDFRYDGQDPIEKLVYDTEIKMNSDSGRGGFTVVAPKIFGSYEEEDRLKVFLTTYSARYKLFGSALSQEGGSVVPAAITYRKDESGSYILENYEQAKDGSYFGPSIREFCTMPVSGEKISGLADKIFNHYRDYEDIRILQRDNLLKHLKANGITEATLYSPSGEIEFSIV